MSLRRNLGSTISLLRLRFFVPCLIGLSIACFNATRHAKGIEVFRDCQMVALSEELKTRASTKIKHVSISTGQGEFFQSLHDMAPDDLMSFFDNERAKAEYTLLELTPAAPHYVTYERLWPLVLARYVVRRPDVNAIAARLRKEGRLHFPDWEKGKRVPQPNYRVHRATTKES